MGVPALGGTRPHIAAIRAGFSGGAEAGNEGRGSEAEGGAAAAAAPDFPRDASDDMLKSLGRDMPNDAAAAFMSDGDMADRSKPGGREKPAAAAAWAMQFGDGENPRVPLLLLLLLLLPPPPPL